MSDRPVFEDRQRGMTLVELLVAMSLLAIALALITTLMVTLTHTFVRQEAQQQSSRTAAVAMQQVGRVVRGATQTMHSNGWQQLPAVIDARQDRVRLSTYIDTDSAASGPTQIELRLDAGTAELLETRWAARRSGGVWVFESTASRTRTILHGMLPAGTRLPTGGAVRGLFEYVASDGRLLSIPSSGQLSEAQRGEVAAVRVSLAVQTASGGDASPAVIQTTFAMRNLPGPEDD